MLMWHLHIGVSVFLMILSRPLKSILLLSLGSSTTILLVDCIGSILWGPNSIRNRFLYFAVELKTPSSPYCRSMQVVVIFSCEENKSHLFLSNFWSVSWSLIRCYAWYIKSLHFLAVRVFFAAKKVRGKLRENWWSADLAMETRGIFEMLCSEVIKLSDFFYFLQF